MITVYSLLYSYIPNSRDATLQIFFFRNLQRFCIAYICKDSVSYSKDVS